MTIDSLRDLYHDQLQDSYSACAQALDITAELGRAATDEALSRALVDASNGIADGMDKLASLCAAHDIDPEGEHCKGMEGLVREARAHALDGEFGDPDARDAMIITQYQRMGHYAIAAYGCLGAFANRLGLDGDGATLEAMLDACHEGDRRMTEIATGHVNAAAAR